MKKLLPIIILLMSICLFMAGCSDEETDTAAAENAAEAIEAASAGKGAANAAETGDSWAIYWYLCGSDLETNGGFATIDLSEMMEVALPENVNVVIQTGGAAVWQNEYMDPAKLQRWLYSSDGLVLLEEQDIDENHTF